MKTSRKFWLAALIPLCGCLLMGCSSPDARRGADHGQYGPSGQSGALGENGVAQDGAAANDEAAPEAGGGWGNLRGRFTLPGAGEPAKIDVAQDVNFCGKFALVDESIKVNKKNSGLANVVVYLYTRRGEQPPRPHPSYAMAKEQVVLDNRNCRFQPRVLLVRTSQTLKIVNSDPVAHNTKINADDPINPLIPPGRSVEKKFDKQERLPVSVSCSIHPWMRAMLVIRDSPYMAVTDENGAFEIKNLPAGKWTFLFWHEAFGFLSNVDVDGRPIQWPRGRREVTIAAGRTTDLGEVRPRTGED